MIPRIQVLQHVAFEGLGSMASLLAAKHCPIASTHWYRGDQAPALDSFDWLIVMGGPMGVYDEAQHPWLAAEKILIKRAIDAGKTVLGVCLGAQLIACVLGAAVTRNPVREIGWFPIVRQPAAERGLLQGWLPAQVEVFHWHGDTFALPEGAEWLASSHACNHQAFRYGERVLALQFHLETTPSTALALLQHCDDELDGSAWVQTAEQILGTQEQFQQINQLQADLLERLLKG